MIRQRFVSIATIVACIVVAAAPPLGFARYLDYHVVDSAERTLDDYAERIIARADAMLNEGSAILTGLYVAGVVSCDLRARESMRRAVADSRVVQEIAVTSTTGQCGSALVETNHETLSELVPVSAVVGLYVTTDDRERRALALRFQPSDDEVLIAHFVPESIGLDLLPDGWRRHGRAMLMLEDGTIFEEAPSETTLTNASEADRFAAGLASMRYPLLASVEVVKAAVMRDYAGLRAYTFVVMALFAALVMGIAATIARRQNQLSADIAAGLRRREFIPYYQPLLSLATGRLVGCEVLVRRRRRDGSIEVPASFIAQAEMDGQIVAMTRQLMRHVIADLGDRCAAHPRLTVGFNLCAQHFRDDSVVDDIKRIFGPGPIRFTQLVFEVTERFPLVDTARAKTIIAKLQALGARVALDDAGTGHSGLAALHRLGMDVVKIDKIFVDTINAQTTQAPIVDSLVDLAKSYGMSVVAEGVESLDQVRYLKAKGVDAAQGYLFAPPLPASSFLALVDTLLSHREPTEDSHIADAA